MYLFHKLYLRQRNMILPNGEISAVSGQKVTLPEFWDIWVTTHQPKQCLTLIPLLEKSTANKILKWSISSSTSRFENSKEFTISGPNQIIEQYWNPRIRKSASILKSSKWLAEKYSLNFVKATFKVFEPNSKFSLLRREHHFGKNFSHLQLVLPLN